jgi:hypothetical protein
MKKQGGGMTAFFVSILDFGRNGQIGKDLIEI